MVESPHPAVPPEPPPAVLSRHAQPAVAAAPQAVPHPAGASDSADGDPSPNAVSIALWSLAGLTIFLLCLIGAVLLARHLRPKLYGDQWAQDAFEAALSALRNGDLSEEKRREAAAQIVAFGPEKIIITLDKTAKIVGQDDSFQFPTIIIKLLAEQTAHAAAFAPALGSDRANVRAAAAYVLREMGSAIAPATDSESVDPELLAALRRAIVDPNRWTRWYSIETLGNLGRAAAPAVPDLIPMLKHPDIQTRLRTVRALGRIGPPAAAAAAELTRVREDDHDQAVRRAAGEALLDVNLPGLLAAARQKAPDEIRELIDRLQSANEFESSSAASALGKRGREAADAVPALAQALNHPNKWVRAGAAESLGLLAIAGVDISMVMPRLQRATNDPDPEVSSAAQRVLQRLRAPSLP